MRKKWEKVSLGLISLGRNNNRTVRRRKPTRLYRYEFIAFHFSSPRTFYPPRIIRAAYPNMRKAIKQARAFFPSSVANNGKTRTIRQTNIYIYIPFTKQVRNRFQIYGFRNFLTNGFTVLYLYFVFRFALRSLSRSSIFLLSSLENCNKMV